MLFSQIHISHSDRAFLVSVSPDITFDLQLPIKCNFSAKKIIHNVVFWDSYGISCNKIDTTDTYGFFQPTAQHAATYFKNLSENSV
jgi:hypothetical protein